ncbi:MAG: hypothetical protein ABTQ31_12865 [Rhizobiaceae bacterium]
MNIQPFLIGDGWIEVLDGNDTVRAIFDDHYSRRRYADGRKPKLFIGPGEKLVLMMHDASAIAAWRKEKHRLDGQVGVECTIFRRVSGDLASHVLAAARRVACEKWPGERLFTFVDPRDVRPTWRAGRPTWGHCFYQDGWVFEGLTRKRLHILARYPEAGCGL